MWLTLIIVAAVIITLTGYVMRRDRGRVWNAEEIALADYRRRAQASHYMQP